MSKVVWCVAAVILGMATRAKAQGEDVVPVPKLWAKSASFGLNMTNVGLQNWAGGGENSFSIAGLLTGEATYTKDKVQWFNTLEAGYGLMRQGSSAQFRKTDDRLIAVSRWSRDFGHKHLAYTALLDFRTQMTTGYNYHQDENGAWQRNAISRLMAPGYMALSLGASYRPSDDFYALLSPISGKLTFVMDDALSAIGAFGVDSGKTVRKELGAVVNLRYARVLAKNIKFETKANLFQAYRQGAMVDVLWDNLLELKVNDFISSTISTQMIYDEDVSFPNEDGSSSPRVQWKYVFNVGFLFRI